MRCGTVWNNGGTIKKLVVSKLVKIALDCSRSLARVCGVVDVIIYKEAKWVGQL